MKKPTLYLCSFCGEAISGPTLIIRGPEISKRRANICEDCVAVCAMMVMEKSDRYPKRRSNV
jgi:DNA-directed RNA polymerase subunit RPC12/RpoP